MKSITEYFINENDREYGKSGKHAIGAAQAVVAALRQCNNDDDIKYYVEYFFECLQQFAENSNQDSKLPKLCDFMKDNIKELKRSL